MKNNRTNRKLKFIREKNNLRLGITRFSCHEKVSNALDILNVDYWEKLTTTAINSLQKKYRLKLNVVTLKPNQLVNDDFIKDKHTNIVILSRT